MSGPVMTNIFGGARYKVKRFGKPKPVFNKTTLELIRSLPRKERKQKVKALKDAYYSEQ